MGNWPGIPYKKVKEFLSCHLDGLALVYPVRLKVVPTLRVRASVEAYFVSQGWTALRSCPSRLIAYDTHAYEMHVYECTPVRYMPTRDACLRET